VRRQARAESETVERALKLGVANYLLKPFTLDDLAGRLSEYRSQHQRRLRPLVGDQAEIDRIFGRSEPTIAESLPKGMSPETAELILATLRERSDEQSAQQCAAAVGISRVSARRYLEFFVSQGKAQVSLRYGSRAPSADTELPLAVTASSSSKLSSSCVDVGLRQPAFAAQVLEPLSTPNRTTGRPALCWTRHCLDGCLVC
jgi:CheY-like chemotaxis protein